MATIKEPKHIEPNDVVDARLREPETAASLLVNHQQPTTPQVEPEY